MTLTHPEWLTSAEEQKRYARLMVGMARKYRGTRGAHVWARAAQNARLRASQLSGERQGVLPW